MIQRWFTMLLWSGSLTKFRTFCKHGINVHEKTVQCTEKRWAADQRYWRPSIKNCCMSFSHNICPVWEQLWLPMFRCATLNRSYQTISQILPYDQTVVRPLSRPSGDSSFSQTMYFWSHHATDVRPKWFHQSGLVSRI